MRLTLAIETDFAAAKELHAFHTGTGAAMADGPAKYPAWLIAEHQKVTRAFTVIASQALELARCNTASTDIKAAAKKEAKDRATVAAADAPNPQFTPAHTAEIQHAIAAALKSAGKPGKNKGKLVVPTQIYYLPETNSGSSSRSQTFPPPAVKGGQAQPLAQRQQAETQGFKGHKRQLSSWGGGGQEDWRKHREIGKERKVEEELVNNPPPSFTFNKPSSYPDKLLQLTHDAQNRVLVALAQNGGIFGGWRLRSGPHVQSGVSITSKMRLDLGVNLKFLYPLQLDVSHVLLSYENMCNSIRWQWFWSNRVQNNPAWNPHIKLVMKQVNGAPHATRVIEDGLRTGRQRLEEILLECTAP